MDAELESVGSEEYESDDSEDASPPPPVMTFEESFKQMRASVSTNNANEAFAKNPEPPSVIHCVALSKESAAVWFPYPMDQWQGVDLVTGWVIHRYRKDANSNVWRKKGSITILEHQVDLRQYVVPNLQEGCVYRFTVSTKNVRGLSFESDPSNEVVVERPLPSGWFRFYHEQSSRSYYSNIKTNQASWARPDDDPQFVDESVLLQFSPKELSHLRELFREDILHFDVLNVRHLTKITRELGFKISVGKVREMFDSLDINSAVDQNDKLGEREETTRGITQLRDFMLLMLAVKENTMARGCWQRVLGFQKMYRECISNARKSIFVDRRLGNW
jgi:hypothetical protein